MREVELPEWEKPFRWLVLYGQAQAGTLIAHASFDFGRRVLTQSIDLAQTTGDVIGTTFTIGTSALGTITFIPHQIGIPGLGRTMTLNLVLSASQRIRLGGFVIYAAPRRLLQGRA